MRVAAPRPRHTSHGEDKTTEGGQETSGDNTTTASGTKEGDTGANKGKTEEAADEEETTA